MLVDCNGDCTTFDASSGAIWFKVRSLLGQVLHLLSREQIDEGGMTAPANDKEGARFASEVIKNTGKWTTTIPADIAPGQYLLRHE